MCNIMAYITMLISSIEALLLSILYDAVELGHPRTHKSFFSKSENNNILTCPFCLRSRSLSLCSVVLSHFTRLSINLQPSFYIPYSASPLQKKNTS